MSGTPMSRRALMRGAVLLGVGAAVTSADLGALEIAGAGAAFASVPAPTIASCATWGARNPSSPVIALSNNPNKILIHHTDTPNSTDYSQAHAYALCRSIQNDHMDVNGWIDTGQHFTVSRGGYVMEGRHSSLSKLTAGHGMIEGAHCPGQNDQAIGIENEGIYDTVAPPAAHYAQLVTFCAYICSQYGLSATQIYGHRDYYSTDCPGDMLYSMLPQLRLDVAAKLSPAWTVTIDNSSTAFTASANWTTNNYNAQRYGADYRYAAPVLSSDPATYAATIPSAGNYKVETWYPAGSTYNSAAPYVIYTSGGPQTVIVDQTTGGGAWHNLGTFALAAGAQTAVAVSRWTSVTGWIIADAIRITKA